MRGGGGHEGGQGCGGWGWRGVGLGPSTLLAGGKGTCGRQDGGATRWESLSACPVLGLGTAQVSGLLGCPGSPPQGLGRACAPPPRGQLHVVRMAHSLGPWGPRERSRLPASVCHSGAAGDTSSVKGRPLPTGRAGRPSKGAQGPRCPPPWPRRAPWTLVVHTPTCLPRLDLGPHDQASAGTQAGARPPLAPRREELEGESGVWGKAWERGSRLTGTSGLASACWGRQGRLGLLQGEGRSREHSPSGHAKPTAPTLVGVVAPHGGGLSLTTAHPERPEFLKAASHAATWRPPRLQGPPHPVRMRCCHISRESHGGGEPGPRGAKDGSSVNGRLVSVENVNHVG